jgi:putative spermidine/putrescine transport system substrate-binding protein
MNRLSHPAVLAVLLVLIAGVLFYVWKSGSGASLTVVSWAGNYGQAQASAQMTTFARKSGANVRIAQYDGGTNEIADQVAHHRYDWDVVDMELPDAVAACRAGLLERIDVALPPSPGGTPAAADFYPGAIGPCWVASIVYSRLIGFDASRFAAEPPIALTAFFDTQRYPGTRALSRASGKYILELALLADGVKPAAVYDTLSTPAGVFRALRKLDGIKKDILWLGANDTPAGVLAGKRAAFALLLNNDLFEASSGANPPGAIWDGQLIGYDVLAIPRGDPKRALALDYIRYATGAKVLSQLASWLPYGPARQSAVAGVGKNPALDQSLTPFQPTTAARMTGALMIDEGWWRLHGGDIDQIWQTWAH